MKCAVMPLAVMTHSFGMRKRFVGIVMGEKADRNRMILDLWTERFYKAVQNVAAGRKTVNRDPSKIIQLLNLVLSA